jgi:hypothetical protein
MPKYATLVALVTLTPNEAAGQPVPCPYIELIRLSLTSNTLLADIPLDCQNGVVCAITHMH